MSHLLLTNDYPPKIGGIQTYLWELWRRLPGESFQVMTSPHDDSAAFDTDQHHKIHRYDRFWLPPSRRVLKRARSIIDTGDISAAVVDPAWPLGVIAPRLGVPYAVVLHGAEVTIPARLPGVRSMLRRTINGASLVISASRWAEEGVARLVPSMPPTVYVPPGVDTARFTPQNRDQRAASRRRLGLDPEAPLIVGVSRLVPRKGFDTLIDAAAKIASRHPDLHVVIAGTGRDETRLTKRIRASGAPARLLGFVADDDLPDLYASADGFAMLCRDRWGGLEQEGFGIVFVEAAAAGTPQLAGRSGGSAEAVTHGTTGWVVDQPDDANQVAMALAELLDRRHDDATMRAASREHAQQFSYDSLAATLQSAIADLEQS